MFYPLTVLKSVRITIHSKSYWKLGLSILDHNSNKVPTRAITLHFEVSNYETIDATLQSENKKKTNIDFLIRSFLCLDNNKQNRLKNYILLAKIIF